MTSWVDVPLENENNIGCTKFAVLLHCVRYTYRTKYMGKREKAKE